MPLGHAVDVLIGCQRNPTRAAGPDRIPYLRSANVLAGRLDLSDVLQMAFSPAERRTYSLQPGDVMVTEGSASPTAVGAPARWGGEIGGTVTFQNTLLRLRARTGVTDPRFVYQWARYAHESGLYLQATGSSILHLGAKRTSNVLVALPPLAEQASISEVLDGADAFLDSLRKEAEKVALVVSGMREDLFGKRGQTRAPLARFADMNPEQLGSGTPGRAQFRYIDISSVKRGYVAWDQVQTVTFATAPSRARRVLRPGDVLFSTVRPLLGSHTYFGEQSDPPAICSTGFAVLRPKPNTAPRFLFHALFWSEFESQVRQAQVGSNYPAVNEKDVASFMLPDVDLTEQLAISTALDGAVSLHQSLSAEIRKMTAVRVGLAVDLITGAHRLTSNSELWAGN